RRLIFVIVIGALLAGCAPQAALVDLPKVECRDMPLGEVVVLGDGKLHVCHETPERIDLWRNR
ncbi:hypothetical protein MYX64_12855, partial [Nitrospinae bacterium AH_259_B05_G02_I21]|nr:hypothetical protein [Nitrospinae bacterium AH_259_B05_G02_I21]